MAHEYMTASINSSPTIVAELGADLPNAPHKAVAFNEKGELVLATNGHEAFGVLISSTSTNAKKGERGTVQIRHRGLIEAGGAIPMGAIVTINDQGQAIVAEAGTAVFGRAFSTAEAAGEIVQVNIAPTGIIPGATINEEKGD